MIRERQIHALPGIPVLLVLLTAIGLAIWQLIEAAQAGSTGLVITYVIGLTLAVFLLAGLFVVNPNEGKVLQFFGDYVGTAKAPGLRWANPLYTKKQISLRVRNFESA